MARGDTPATLLLLALVQVVIFIVSLPGFGIETRTPSQYAAWAGPIFLLLTVLVLVLGVAALLARSRRSTAIGLVMAQAFLALVTNFFDISAVGGPKPPTGPLTLGVISIIVAFITLILGASLRRPGR